MKFLVGPVVTLLDFYAAAEAINPKTLWTLDFVSGRRNRAGLSKDVFRVLVRISAS